MRRLAFVLVLLSCGISCTLKGKGVVQEEKTPPDTVEIAQVSAPAETVYVVTVESLVETVYVMEGTSVLPTTVSPGVGVFTVQVGAFASEENATTFHNLLKVEYSDFVYIEDISPYWKVRIGSYESHSHAEPILEQLRNKGYRDAWIVSVGDGPR
jgi:cell division protein FtsN